MPFFAVKSGKKCKFCSQKCAVNPQQYIFPPAEIQNILQGKSRVYKAQGMSLWCWSAHAAPWNVSQNRSKTFIGVFKDNFLAFFDNNIQRYPVLDNHVHEEKTSRGKRERKFDAFCQRKNFPGYTNKILNNIVKWNILTSMLNLIHKYSTFLICTFLISSLVYTSDIYITNLGNILDINPSLGLSQIRNKTLFS